MFTPKWKKQSIQLLKGSKKFLHYKRDLLEADRIEEITSRQADLKSAIKEKDKEQAKEAGKMLENTCKNALPTYRSPNALAENVEVFFVAIVIALGIRAYFLQPFRIPTGSMQPTLNGITGTELAQDEWPSLPVRLAQKATHGRTYFAVTSGNRPSRVTSIEDYTTFHFFSRCKVTFTDGPESSFSGSKSALWNAGYERTMVDLALKQFGKFGKTEILDLDNKGNPQRGPDGQYLKKWVMVSRFVAHDQTASLVEQQIFAQVDIPANTVLASGYSESGDLILVDKMSYHFRKPENGEVMVFDTRGIDGIHKQARESGQPLGSHYIKRLIGSPGDTISLRNGSLLPDGRLGAALVYRNGEKAKEPGILRVEGRKDGHKGYYVTGNIINDNKSRFLEYLPSTGKSEYWLQGDNSGNSFDSRGWGTVKEYNVVGPAFFSLWPFGSGHWGVIK